MSVQLKRRSKIQDCLTVVNGRRRVRWAGPKRQRSSRSPHVTGSVSSHRGGGSPASSACPTCDKPGPNEFFGGLSISGGPLRLEGVSGPSGPFPGLVLEGYQR